MTDDAPEEKYLSTRKILNLSDDVPSDSFLIKLAEKITGVDKFNNLMEDIGRPWPEGYTVVEQLFERLNIKWDIENPEILEQLDDKPKVFVANHPYGLPDAFALFQLLTRYRPSAKIFANKLLEASQLKDDRLLFVDPFGAVDTRGQNRKSMAAALKHLREGGDLALFPGRICSHLKASDWTISDSEWTDQIRKFVDISGGDMVPLHISGRNSIAFNLSGLIHPRIRTYMLMREFLRGGHDFTFKVGEPVSAEDLVKVSRTVPTGQFCRSLTYALKTGASNIPDIPQLIEPELLSEKELKTLNRVPKSISGQAVKTVLDNHETLIRHNGFTVYHSEIGAPDQMMDIICEVRFRAYESETSMTDPSELHDSFDEFYNHLILWDDQKETVAGVYRYTLPNPKDAPITPQNLVTSSIFNIKPEFHRLMPNSMELGRAAILPEYQKSYSPLMLLWRAILEVPRRNKDIKYLFGPVTMGRNFNPVSRELLRRFIMTNWADETMGGLVSPKRLLELEIPREVDMESLEKACGSFSQLGNIVNGFEGGKRNLPVLFRHYANVGSKYAGFGEWKELDHAAAGLTILDLKNVSNALITRYFGDDGAKAFLAGR